jgi:two-component system cell cycle response regulator
MPARILVVDDNAANRDLMVYLLRAFGHDVTEKETAESGLAAALSDAYDLILSDILMPGFDGYELARRVRASGDKNKAPLVAVTALAMVGDRDRVLAAGFDGYIPKPIDPQIFVSQVDALLPQALRSSARQTPGAAETGKAASAPAGPVILAVDDERINLEVIRGALEPFGYRVIAVGSASEALEKLKSQTPALILCDVHMPGRDGYALIKIVKADPEAKKVPFVFMSSTVWTSSDIARGLALGAAEFIVRPIDPATLIGVVERVLA